MRGAFLLLTSFFASVFGAGEVLFLQSPDSVQFRGHQQLKLSMLADVLSRASGFSVRQASDWSGMSITNPWGFAEAIVMVVLPGISEFNTDQGHHFSLTTDEPLEDTWQKMLTEIELRFQGQNQTYSKVTLGEADDMLIEESDNLLTNVKPIQKADYKLKYLKPENEEDQAFLNQIKFLKGVPSVVSEKLSPNGVPDIFWIVVPGMHPLADKYGVESKPVHEAKRILADTMVPLTDAFTGAYNGKVVVATLSSDAAHTRRYKRAAGAANALSDFELTDDDYSEDYAAIFNIILWLTLAFIFSLIAIAISIVSMDPGRDSIIYRMTSNRMKKDN